MTNSEKSLSFDRMLAGYDAEEKSKATQRQLERLLVELLGIVDALRDLELHCAELERKGTKGVPRRSVDIVLRKVMAVLASHHVTPMNCKGQPFDLEKHEVMEVKSVRDSSDDIVLEESVHGYMWRERVLRHAKVIISRAEAASNPSGKAARRGKRSRKRSAGSQEASQ
jgi:molecular chaperone GrpE